MDRSKEDQAAFDDLDRQIIAIHAAYRPAIVQGFAEFVFKQGARATMPLELHGKKVSLKLAGKSWQAVGRELYGAEFVEAFKAIVKKHA